MRGPDMEVKEFKLEGQSEPKYCTLRFAVDFVGGRYRLKWHSAHLTQFGRLLQKRFGKVMVNLDTEEVCEHGLSDMDEHALEWFDSIEQLEKYVKQVANKVRSIFNELESENAQLNEEGLGEFYINV